MLGRVHHFTRTVVEAAANTNVVAVSVTVSVFLMMQAWACSTIALPLSDTSVATVVAGDIADDIINAAESTARSAARTPQLPNLLSGYAVRPPWQVAGVDYAVGIAAGTVLKDPAAMHISGVSIDTAHKLVIVSGSNVVLDGWNFNDWTVSIASGARTSTVTNNNFTHGFLRYEPGSSMKS